MAPIRGWFQWAEARDGRSEKRFHFLMKDSPFHLTKNRRIQTGPVYFSGKITNSFFEFLKKCEFDTSRFFEMTPLEIDFLKNPDSWMEARQVERLLNNIQKNYGYHFMDKDLVTTVGHNCADLKCWGGLEMSLEMFKEPKRSQLVTQLKKIHERLDKFFSNFMFPVFKIYNQIETKNSVCFEVGFDSDKYPVVTWYFKAILEALPVFLGGELTEVKWQDHRLEIFYPAEESLPLPFMAPDSSPPDRDSLLLEKIKSCEDNLVAFKENKAYALLDQTLKILSELQRELKKRNK